MGSATCREVGRGDRDRAGAGRGNLRHPPLLREFLCRAQRGADPEIRRGRQAARRLGRRDVRVPARRDGGSRRQSLGDRRAGRGRQGTSGRQVQSRWQGGADARQGRRQRRRQGSLRPAHRRRGLPRRRHLRDRQPSQRQEQPRGAVLEERRVRERVGPQGIRPRRVQRAAHDRDRLARAPVGRRSREQQDPDLRSGRHVPRRVAPVRPAERDLHHEGRRDLRRRFRVRPRHRRARAARNQEGHPDR